MHNLELRERVSEQRVRRRDRRQERAALRRRGRRRTRQCARARCWLTRRLLRWRRRRRLCDDRPIRCLGRASCCQLCLERRDAPWCHARRCGSRRRWRDARRANPNRKLSSLSTFASGIARRLVATHSVHERLGLRSTESHPVWHRPRRGHRRRRDRTESAHRSIACRWCGRTAPHTTPRRRRAQRLAGGTAGACRSRHAESQSTNHRELCTADPSRSRLTAPHRPQERRGHSLTVHQGGGDPTASPVRPLRRERPLVGGCVTGGEIVRAHPRGRGEARGASRLLRRAHAVHSLYRHVRHHASLAGRTGARACAWASSCREPDTIPQTTDAHRTTVPGHTCRVGGWDKPPRAVHGRSVTFATDGSAPPTGEARAQSYGSPGGGRPHGITSPPSAP